MKKIKYLFYFINQKYSYVRISKKEIITFCDT